MEMKKCRVERKHEVELTVRGWRPVQESESGSRSWESEGKKPPSD
jgi:hypothetical protein